LAKRDKKKDSKGFQHSPFKALKGVAVAEDKPPVNKRAAVPDAAAAPVAEDDAAAFEREMTLLGVDRRTTGGRERENAPPEVEAATETEQAAPELSDEELFLASLGQMDSRFRDEFSLPGEVDDAAAPRRMRQLRQGKRSPEARLDLHGLNRQEARDKVRFFLEDAVFHGFKTVLIITGRGKGSAEGPVLRNFMEGYLSREARAWVVEWGRAPARYGGEGALVVFLKGRSNR